MHVNDHRRVCQFWNLDCLRQLLLPKKVCPLWRNSVINLSRFANRAVWNNANCVRQRGVLEDISSDVITLLLKLSSLKNIEKGTFPNSLMRLS